MAKHREQIAGERVHACRAVADVRPVLVAGSGDMEAAVAEVRSMRWGMPRLAVRLAPRKQLRALLRRELAPQILGLGHGEVYFSRSESCLQAVFPTIYLRPRKRGTPNHSESRFGVPPSGGPNCTVHPILRLAFHFPLSALSCLLRLRA